MRHRFGSCSDLSRFRNEQIGFSLRYSLQNSTRRSIAKVILKSSTKPSLGPKYLIIVTSALPIPVILPIRLIKQQASATQSSENSLNRLVSFSESMVSLVETDLAEEHPPAPSSERRQLSSSTLFCRQDRYGSRTASLRNPRCVHAHTRSLQTTSAASLMLPYTRHLCTRMATLSARRGSSIWASVAKRAGRSGRSCWLESSSTRESSRESMRNRVVSRRDRLQLRELGESDIAVQINICSILVQVGYQPQKVSNPKTYSAPIKTMTGFDLWCCCLKSSAPHLQPPFDYYNPCGLLLQLITTTDSHMQVSLLVLVLLVSCLSYPSFFNNKPHQIFHLGDRALISTNMGLGFWCADQPLRLAYKNTQDQLYVDMRASDGESLIWESVQDRRCNATADIRYQNLGAGWEVEVQVTAQTAGTWLVYFTVENNDYRLATNKHISGISYFSPEYGQDRSHVDIEATNMIGRNQTFRLLSRRSSLIDGAQIEDEVKIFGGTANISETYTIESIADTLRRLVRISKGEIKPAKPKDPSETLRKLKNERDPGQRKQLEEKLADMKKEEEYLKWEKDQLKLIKEDKWTGRNYAIMILYGHFDKDQATTIYLTNMTEQQLKPSETSPFRHEAFNKSVEALVAHHSRLGPGELAPFLNHVVSNLYAGLTFYFGRLYTQNSLTMHKQDYSYSFTPSRLIFPRSFLWDDGFHQSVIVNYNPRMVLEVLENWMNKIDIFGWVGREQIRGAEISSMMPEVKFVYQDWFEMNPPTLLMSMLKLIQKAKDNPQLDADLQTFFINYYRKIEMWYRYFKNTQSHQSLSYGEVLNSTDRFFRWHCKDECSKGNFFGSGLDDYPRRGAQGEIAKEHVDLVSWLYFFSKGLAEIGVYMEQKNQEKLSLLNITQSEAKPRNKYSRRIQYYEQQAKNYIYKLYNSFYDPSDSLFKDITVQSASLYVQKFVQNIGYINLFPFFTGMLRASQAQKYQERRVKGLKKVIEIMRDRQILMSDDGLRSLSISDPLYGTDQNYWRGAVWLPINYLVLRACKLYYWDDPVVSSEVQQLYAQLRSTLVNTVYETYKKTGYLFENYYEGNGHRGYPFYGWTSTIANIITQQY